MNAVQDEQLSIHKPADAFDSQSHQLNLNSVDLASQKRLEIIRMNEALKIFETYYARYRKRCDGKEQDDYLSV